VGQIKGDLIRVTSYKRLYSCEMFYERKRKGYVNIGHESFYFANTAMPAHAVTFIKQSLVLRGHLFVSFHRTFHMNRASL
jgi:hypothetical protein